VSTAAIWTGTTAEKFKRYVSRLLFNDIAADGSREWHDGTLIPLYDLQPPNVRGKDVANSDTLLVLLTFNIKYDTGIFSSEGHRVQLLGCYQGLAFTGARPAEFVDGENKSSQDSCWQEISRASQLSDNKADGNGGDELSDEDYEVIEELLSQETASRGRPKALCYEDILLMVVRHPQTGEDVLAMSIKFIHHKGADNKPKPYVTA
jgi:hypothetical protein